VALVACRHRKKTGRTRRKITELTNHQFKTKETTRNIMKRIKTLTIPLACVAGFALAVSQASAALVVKGDFTAGNRGFTSGYEYTAAAGGLATGGEGPGKSAGKYDVDPKYNLDPSAKSLFVVPEPTTMIVGALLLLPFAASTLRMVRKNRAA
jgi:hypothetical protein